jgi:hypothetical protein
MRTRTSLVVVGAALATALGLLDGCGGIASRSGAADGGASSGVGGAGTKPVAGSPSGPPRHVCTAHPCVNPTPIIVGDADTGYDTCAGGPLAGGALRRRAIVDCPSLLPRAATNCPSLVDAGPGAWCTKDSDCTEHPFGWCGGQVSDMPCGCIYGCVRDSDCLQNTACVCADPVGYCPDLPTGCTSGKDCQSGCDCVEAFSGFQCQTPQDSCLTDTDCAEGGACVYCTPYGDPDKGSALSCSACESGSGAGAGP